jgi:predicted N-formylglutamate amidohydrolase
MGGFLAGDDEPYGAEPEVDYTIFAHAFHHGLKHVQVEFRQDLVGTDEGAQHWGAIFADSVEQTLAQT